MARALLRSLPFGLGLVFAVALLWRSRSIDNDGVDNVRVPRRTLLCIVQVHPINVWFPRFAPLSILLLPEQEALNLGAVLVGEAELGHMPRPVLCDVLSVHFVVVGLMLHFVH